MQDQKDVEGNLLMLLRSEQESDVQLGLHLAASPTIPLNDLTDLIAVALFHRKPDWRELGEAALAVQANQEERNFLNQRWESTHRQGDNAPFFSAVGRLTQLERVIPEHLYRLAVRYTWRFPEDVAHKIPAAFLEYCEANISPYASLNLSGKRIPVLPPEIGRSEQFKSLQDLSMVFCRLRKIPDEIAEMKKLEKLNLMDNELKDLPDALGKLTQLRELRWTGNPIRKFPRCLRDLVNLEQLQMNVRAGFDFSGLEHCRHFRSLVVRFEKGAGPFPPEMLALDQVESLNVYARLWEHGIPESLMQWQQLKKLELFLDPQHSFPHFVRQLAQLRSLKISMVPHWDDTIETVPQPDLSEIELRICRWKEWPANWCEFPALERLQIVNSKIAHLPPEFARLQSLQSFDLMQAPILEFPRELLELSNLRSLHLHNTGITELPADIHRLTRLETLSLAGSEIRHLPASIRKLSKLKLLRLTNLKLNRHEVKELVADMPGTEIVWS